MQFTAETDLLKPRDAALLNSDDWPTFTLSNAIVHAEDHSPANLLHADAQNALTVQGKLEHVLREHEHLRLQPEYRATQPIEITEVRQFAYGQYEDGAVEIWAAGKAGWYAIKPSRGYKQTYNEMVQALEMLYFVADVYTAPVTKSRKGRQGLEGHKSDVSAHDVFQRWAEKRPEAGGDPDIAAKQFYKHRYFLLASMLAGKEGIVWTKTPIYRHLEHKFPEDVQTLQKRMTIKAAKPRRSATPKTEMIKRKRESPAIEQHPAMGADEPKTNGDKTRRARGRPRRTLDAVSDLIISTPRAQSTRTSSIADTGDETPDLPTKGHKGKSVLRPRPSKYVPKQTEEMEISDDVEGPTPAERLAAVKRTSPTKRKMDEDLAAPQPKRRNSRLITAVSDQATAGAGNVDEGIDMPLDEDHDDDSLDMTIQGDKTGSGSPLVFRLRKEDLKADGEGDKWTCPLDGCMHTVYAALESASQKLIKEHYRLHVNDEDADTRLQLVKRMEAPGLPVDRLMSRIQMMAGKRGFPAPIIRRY